MTPYLSGWLAAREEAARVAEQAAESASREDCGNDHGEGIASTIRALTPPAAPEGFEEWHARECPCPSDDYDSDNPWVEGVPQRFIGRTCREVYAAENPAPEPSGECPTPFVPGVCLNGTAPGEWCAPCGRSHPGPRCSTESQNSANTPAPEPRGGAGDEDYGMAPGACGTFRDIPEGPCFCGRNASMKHYRVHLTDACYPTIESWKAARDTVPGASRTPRVSDREPGRGVAVQPPPEGDGLPTPTGTTPSAAGRLAEAVTVDAILRGDFDHEPCDDLWTDWTCAHCGNEISEFGGGPCVTRIRAERAGRE